MDITELLKGDFGKQIISGISKQAGTTEEETNSVVGAGIPVLLGMLKNNASTPEGAESIKKALNKHDGNILNDMQGFFGDKEAADGKNILGHILGAKQGTVESSISKSTGVSGASVSKILALIAPVVMGMLGKKSKTESGGIGDLLGGLMGGSGSSSLGGDILSSVLGGKGDLGGLGDVISSVTGKGKKKGGLGGLLGGMFGGK